MTELDCCADAYVELGLHFHQYDQNPFIYIGPQSLLQRVRAAPMALEQVEARLNALQERVSALQPVEPRGDLRQSLLKGRLVAMRTRAAILQGRMPQSFEEEASLLYGVHAPQRGEAHFHDIAKRLDEVVPSSGQLPQRVAAFRDRFLIPPERIEAVMRVTLAEARCRTQTYWTLPKDECVQLQFDRGGPFVGFADYQGNHQSVVHFNLAAPIHLDRVIELCTHEAYPGHHVQGCLIEEELVRARGWREFSLTPLFGSQTTLLEGAANYGVNLAFTPQERQAYDLDVIMPLAGLSHLASDLPAYHQLIALLEDLNHARNEAARRYLYHGVSREEAVDWLMDYGLETRPMAEQRLSFIDAVRSYVVTYNLGLDWVTERIDRDAALSRAQRWNRLRELLLSPEMPHGLPNLASVERSAVTPP